MMPKVRRIDFSPDEWLAGTAELNLEEIGLYITACALIYSRGGPIQRDHLQAVVKVHGNTFNRIIGRLGKLGKVSIKGDEIGQKRCEAELKNAQKRSKNGRKNVAKRWGAVSLKINGLDEKLPGKTLGKPSENPGKTFANSQKNPGNVLANLSENVAVSLEINDLAKETVLLRGKANHQPSTINHQPSLDADASRVGRARAPDPPENHPQDRKNGRKPRKTTIPADWELGDEGRQYARQRGHPDDWIDEESERFRDKAARDAAAYSDWQAAWRNWVRTAEDFAARDRRWPNGGAKMAESGPISAAVNAIRARRMLD